MAFVRIRPAPPLSDSIAMIWDWHVEPGPFRLERVLPAPGASLIINLFEDATRVYTDDAARGCEHTAGTVISGQATRSFLIDTAEQIAVMGVMFLPGGAARFVREPMHRLSDRHAALSDLGFAGTATLRERLLEADGPCERIGLLEGWLRARHIDAGLHPVVAHALHTLAGSPELARIGPLARASGYSPRRFASLFRDQVGIGAKRHARLLRFRQVIGQIQAGRPVDWTRVANDCGFHDQPHLVREFRAFSGMTPSAYLKQRGDHVNHVALD